VAEQLEQDIADAREALAEGEAELTRLHEAFLNGEPGVEWSHVKSQQAVVEYAEAQIERIARQAARSAEAQRQAKVDEIAREIDAYVLPEGTQAVALLAEVETAITKFAASFAEHNARLRGWRERLAEAGVTPTPGRRGDVGILSSNGNLFAGDREIKANILAGRALRELLHVLHSESVGTDLWGQFQIDDTQFFHLNRSQLTTLVEGLTGGTVNR